MFKWVSLNWPEFIQNIVVLNIVFIKKLKWDPFYMFLKIVKSGSCWVNQVTGTLAMLDKQYQVNSHSIYIETKLDLEVGSTGHHINPTSLARFNNISKNFLAMALTQATY